MKKRIGLILVGGSGRMGTEIQKLLPQRKDLDLLASVGKQAIPKFVVGKELLLIDFSSPAGFVQALRYCMREKVPFVSGTTGLTPKHFALLKRASKKIPVLWAPNMSPGVNVFYNLVAKIGHTFSEFDLTIEESHHKRKKDSPSGTALELKRLVEKSTGKKQISVSSIRAGGIVGQHRLSLIGEEEGLFIEHVAWSRSVFARGALDVGVWLVRQKAGLYEMTDYINRS